MRRAIDDATAAATACFRGRPAHLRVVGAFSGMTGRFDGVEIITDDRISRRRRRCVLDAFAAIMVAPFRTTSEPAEAEITSGAPEPQPAPVASSEPSPSTRPSAVTQPPPRTSDDDDDVGNADLYSGENAPSRQVPVVRRGSDALAPGNLRVRAGNAPTGPGGPAPAGFTVEPGNSLADASASDSAIP